MIDRVTLGTKSDDSSADMMRQLLELRATMARDVDDAGRVLVTNDGPGSSQLFEIGVDGQWQQLTAFDDAVVGRYLPGDPRRLVMSVNPDGNERTQLWLLDLDVEGARPQPLVHDPDHIHTLLDVSNDTVFYTTNRRNDVDFDIVMRTVSTGKERVLYDGGGSFDDLAVSPDGAWIAVSRMTLLAASSQLLLIDTTTGAVTEITDPKAPGEWHHLHWVDDTLIASSDSGGERFDIRRYDVTTSTWQTLLADPDADLAAVPDASGRRWAIVRSCNGIDQLSIREGEQITHVTLPGDGVLTFFTDLRWSPDGSTLAMTWASPASPPEAYTWSADSGLRRRTVSNDEHLLPSLPAVQLRHVPSFDGEQVPVFVWQADDPDGSAVIYIHGGPEGVTVLSWNPVAAALCAAGHTVVLPNVRGSAGYGRRWVSLDDIEKRLDSVADLAAIHDWLPTIGVDAKRAALYGGSYGGYMVLAGLTFQPERWAAGVDIVGISSLVTFLENTSAYRRVYREREYGSLAEHRDILEAASPLPIIDRLRAPLFIIHGRNDPRVPLSEAEQVAAAARANGVDCELVVYDDEGHGLAKRANRLDAYPRAAEFLARVLA